MTIGPEAELSTKSISSSAWDTVLSILPAQLASVIWSNQLGLNIDDPFMGQSTLTRVVSGVRLHPVKATK
jgi:tagatose-6-phosphate ketose/aldose isomerase